MQIVNPPGLPRALGFSHGVLVPAHARVLYVAGQTAASDEGTIAATAFVAQFDVALEKVLQVVQAAGGNPGTVAKMTMYVTDLEAYRASRAELSEVWKRKMGAHYPAIALVQVAGLLDEGAVVEIQAEAVLS